MARRFLALAAVGLILAAGPAGSAWAHGGHIVAHGAVVGRIVDLEGSSLTIQTPGRQIGVVNALIAAGNRVTREDYPYVYGGGHAQAGTASVGIPGPGYNGHRRGFDCSGAVAAVLAGGGLWPAAGGVPSDAGIISELKSQGLIARGVGKGPVEVTLYDDPGAHIFMNIDGRFFGTSDGGGGGNRRGGAGWLNDGAPDATTHYYRRYHFRRAVLRQTTSSGHLVTFQAGGLQTIIDQLGLGENVRVHYQESWTGTMMASAIGLPGDHTITGTVASLGLDGTSFTIQTPSEASLTFSTSQDPGLLGALFAGQTVQVTYTKAGGTLVARLVLPAS